MNDGVNRFRTEVLPLQSETTKTTIHMKVLLTLLSVTALTSCATYFQQLASVSSSQMTTAPDGHFCYEQDGVTVDYNFWAPNGKFSFVLTNNLDTDIYVDLGRSFLVVNGLTFDYFQNRAYSTNSVSTVVSSSAFGTSYTYGGAVGYGNASASSYGNSAYGNAYSAVSGSSRTSASATSLTASSSVSRSIQYMEKEGVWVPAHSSRSFCEFSLMSVPFRKCGFARNPTKKEDMTLYFNESNTPYSFENMLMLVVDGSDRRVVNSFYVSELTNKQEVETYEEKDEVTCDGTPTGLKVRIYKYSSPGRFYIDYRFNPRDLTSGGNDREKKAGSPSATGARWGNR